MNAYLVSLSDPEFDSEITLREAYIIMMRFVEEFNEIGVSTTDDLYAMISVKNDGSREGGVSLDPAMVSDFLDVYKSNASAP